jgi:hypothetical protein
MAHFWTHSNKEDTEGLSLIPLNGFDAFMLTGDPDTPVKGSKGTRDYTLTHVFKEKSDRGDELFVLLAPAGARQQVRVNGDPVVAGIHVLQHRDEIVVRNCKGESLRLYFSAEKIARIEQLTDEPHTVSCARCYKRINPGNQIVRCPSCSAVHHQSDEFNCWTYAEKCANSMCFQNTEINSGFRWVP